MTGFRMATERVGEIAVLAELVWSMAGIYSVTEDKYLPLEPKVIENRTTKIKLYDILIL